MEMQFELNGCFNDFSWLAKVAYLSGTIFTYLNELKLNLQGAAAKVLKVEDKLKIIIKNGLLVDTHS